MKAVFVALVSAAVLLSMTSAHATGVDREDLRAKLVQILKRLGAYQPPRATTETVSCSGADGTTVSFTTSTAKDRQLTSPVRVKIGGQTTTVPALLVTTYANEDAAITMKAYRALSTSELFALNVKLVPTTAPQTDEVATYAGKASVNAGTESEVTCSAFRQGAGMLKAQAPQPQPNYPNAYANIAVACSRETVPGTPIVAFEIAGGKSQRLASDLNETRAPGDTETLPAFLFSQNTFKKSATLIEFDDGSPEGNMIARLDLTGVRVPTSQPAADPAIYGMWSGTYQRFDAGRELNEAVTCVAF